MRMEHITENGLLKAYVKGHYPKGIVVAVNMDSGDSAEETAGLYKDLKNLGVLPDCFIVPGWFIFETTAAVHMRLMRDYYKASHAIYIFEGGELIDENR